MTMSNTAISSPQRVAVSSRKTNKPLMEKKRRARINNSLAQLKTLVIQGSKKDSSQFNKLEKADILELTVKHLRNLQDQHLNQQQQPQISTNPSPNGKYQAGFMECANEVIRYLGQSPSLGDDTKSRVIRHLANCVQLSSKVSLSKPAQQNSTASTNSSILVSETRTLNSQLIDGQVINIVNNQTLKLSSGSSPVHQTILIAPVLPTSTTSSNRIPVTITSLSATSTAKPTQPSNIVRYTQPLKVQIPKILSPVVHPPTAIPQIQTLQASKIQDISPQMIPESANAQKTQLHHHTPIKKPRERSTSPIPFRPSHKYFNHDDIHMTFAPRSRTYSLTSSSSESEMSSPLNLSQSPRFHSSMDTNAKCTNSRNNQSGTPSCIPLEKFSQSSQFHSSIDTSVKYTSSKNIHSSIQLENHLQSPQFYSSMDRNAKYTKSLYNPSLNQSSIMPDNLIQSPQFYSSIDTNSKCTNSQNNHSPIQTNKLSHSNPYSRDNLFQSHCISSSFPSVIMDSRKIADSHIKLMHFADDDKYFLGHDGSTSPASSMGEERLWRPW